MTSLKIDTLCQIVLIAKSNKMRKAGNVARMEELRKAFRVVVVKPKGKRPNERPRLLKNNIKMDLNETEWLWTGFVWFRMWTRRVLPLTW